MNSRQAEVEAVHVIKASWIKYLARRRLVGSATSGMENRCHQAFEKMHLSRLYAPSRMKLFIVRGPLLVVRVALEWLADEIRPIIDESRYSGFGGMIFRPHVMAVQ